MIGDWIGTYGAIAEKQDFRPIGKQGYTTDTRDVRPGALRRHLQDQSLDGTGFLVRGSPGTS